MGMSKSGFADDYTDQEPSNILRQPALDNGPPSPRTPASRIIAQAWESPREDSGYARSPMQSMSFEQDASPYALQDTSMEPPATQKSRTLPNLMITPLHGG